MLALTVQVDIWALVGGLATFAVAVAWLVSLQAKQRAQSISHKAHEDLCAERYRAIEQTHRQLVKVTDERHAENRERLEGLDEKLSIVLQRLGHR